MAEYLIGGTPPMQFNVGGAPSSQPGSWPRVAIGGQQAPSAPPQNPQAAQIPRQAPRVSFAAPPLGLEELQFCRSLVQSMVDLRPDAGENADENEDEETLAKKGAMLALSKSTIAGLDAWIEAAKAPAVETQPEPVAHAAAAAPIIGPRPQPFRRPGLGAPRQFRGQYPQIPKDQAPAIKVTMNGDQPIITQDTTGQPIQAATQPVAMQSQQQMAPSMNAGSRYKIGHAPPLKFQMDGQDSIPDPGNATR